MKSFFVRRSTLKESDRRNISLVNQIKEMQEHLDQIASRPRIGDHDVRVERKFDQWYCDLYRYSYPSRSYDSWSERSYRVPRTPERIFIKRMGPFKTQAKAIKSGHKFVYRRLVDRHIAKADHQMNMITETTVTV